MDRKDPKKISAAAGPQPFDAVGFTSRVILGLVLAAAGTFKSASPAEEFALIIQSYQLQFISPDLALSLAVFMPWAELLIGYALILGYLTRQAAMAATGLLICFVGALLSIKLRDIQLPNCGCFGVRGFHPSPTMTLCMDFALFGLAYLAWTRGRTAPSLDNWADGSYT